MMTHVETLVKLVGWTGRGVAAVDWDHVEARVGVRLPSDYKELVETFPPGRFNGYLEVVQPRSSDPLDVEAYIARVFHEISRLSQSIQEMGLAYSVIPTIPGLFPWGNIDGEYLACSYLTGRSGGPLTSYVARVPSGAWIDLGVKSIVDSITDMICGRVFRVSGLLETDKPPRFKAVPRP